MRVSKWACLVATALTAGPTLGTTYYVKIATTDLIQNGTQAHPFRCPQSAANIVNPGDNVIVQAGIYKTSVCGDTIIDQNRSGSSGNPITWTFEDNVVFLNDNSAAGSYGVELNEGANSHITDVVFNFKNAAIVDMGRSAFEIHNGTRITIDGSQSSADWYNVQNAGSLSQYPAIYFRYDCQYCTVSKMHVLDSAIGLRFGMKESTVTEPTNCSAVECLAAYSDGFDDPGDGDGFQATGRYCSENTFTKCVAYYCSDDGFDLGQGAHDCTVDSCVAAYNGGDCELCNGVGLKFGTHASAGFAAGGFQVIDCVAFGNKAHGFGSFGLKQGESGSIDDNVFSLCVGSWNSFDQFNTERGDIQLRKCYACRETDSIYWTARQKTSVGTIHEYTGDYNWLVGTEGWKDGGGDFHPFTGDKYDTNPDDDDVDNWSVNVSRIGPGTGNHFAEVAGPVMPWDGP